jgi:hypothetical protein
LSALGLTRHGFVQNKWESRFLPKNHFQDKSSLYRLDTRQIVSLYKKDVIQRFPDSSHNNLPN